MNETDFKKECKYSNGKENVRTNSYNTIQYKLQTHQSKADI
jgi:hypothetical protein